jgi:hypothetical protein
MVERQLESTPACATLAAIAAPTPVPPTGTMATLSATRMTSFSRRWRKALCWPHPWPAPPTKAHPMPGGNLPAPAPDVMHPAGVSGPWEVGEPAWGKAAQQALTKIVDSGTTGRQLSKRVVPGCQCTLTYKNTCLGQIASPLNTWHPPCPTAWTSGIGLVVARCTASISAGSSPGGIVNLLGGWSALARCGILGV